MNARWIVHCGDEALGPWSAEQVREELRAGRIDPFDLVVLEGGSKKRPLIDVDEIFSSKSSQKVAVLAKKESLEKTVLVAVSGDAASVAKASDASAVFQQNQTNDLKAENPKGRENVGSLHQPRAFEALAAPQAVNRAALSNPVARQSPNGPASSHGVQSAARAGIVRRYVLWTSEQSPQGPFTSREVLTFWYAKKLPPSTIVQRAGQAKRVRIEDFARFYERAEPSGIAFVGEARAVAGRLDASTRGLIFAVMTGLLIVIGALLWSYTPKAILDRANQFSKSITGRPLFESEAKEDRALSQEQSLPVDEISKPKTPSRPSSSRTGSFGSHQGSQKLTGQKRRQQNPKPRADAVRVNRSAKRPAPAPRPSNVAPVARPPTSPGLTEGSIVTLNGYRFSLAALNACDLKCKIPMNGPSGPITAVFFKEAFAAELLKKPSGVSLVGKIRRDPATGKLTILLQGVR